MIRPRSSRGPWPAWPRRSSQAMRPTGLRAASAKPAIVAAMGAALDELSGRLGPDMTEWGWGQLHKIHLRHVLTQRGDLGTLLDRGGRPVRGNGTTVCNTGFDPNWGAAMGANYRLISDLSTDPPGLWAVDAQGQSGTPRQPALRRSADGMAGRPLTRRGNRGTPAARTTARCWPRCCRWPTGGPTTVRGSAGGAERHPVHAPQRLHLAGAAPRPPALAEWLAGRYHYLPLDRDAAAREAVTTLTLTPGG